MLLAVEISIHVLCALQWNALTKGKEKLLKKDKKLYRDAELSCKRFCMQHYSGKVSIGFPRDSCQEWIKEFLQQQSSCDEVLRFAVVDLPDGLKKTMASIFTGDLTLPQSSPTYVFSFTFRLARTCFHYHYCYLYLADLFMKLESFADSLSHICFCENMFSSYSMTYLGSVSL